MFTSLQFTGWIKNATLCKYINLFPVLVWTMGFFCLSVCRSFSLEQIFEYQIYLLNTSLLTEVEISFAKNNSDILYFLFVYFRVGQFRVLFFFFWWNFTKLKIWHDSNTISKEEMTHFPDIISINTSY